MVKNIFCVLFLFLLASCGWWKLSELNNNLEKLEEFNEKYADQEKLERDEDDENRDQNLLDDFRFACEWDNEKEYTLHDEDANMKFPEDLVPDTTKLTNNCIQAGTAYVEYLKWDYTENNIVTATQAACLQPKIDQTETALSIFKSTNTQLASRYANLPIKFILAEKILEVVENQPDEYSAIWLLHLDYGKHKISMITNSTLHLITKDVCIEKWIAKDVLESFDPTFDDISDGFNEATQID